MTLQLDPELFLPEPTPRDINYTVISVDDHVVEPPHTFEGRLPASLQARAPYIVETSKGHQVWEFEGERYSQVGMNAVAGRRGESVRLEPFRFEQVRPGCFDVDDHDLGLACIRAWNDWLFEEWHQRHPQRIVPLGITHLADPALAVAEIERNAARGFTSVTFPERPHLIGLPSLWERDHWDPIIAACADTGTVISLHVGSSGTHGIGWVAMLLDRLDAIVDRSAYGRGWDDRPADVLQRNFWFCTLDDPSTIDTRHRIGVENIMVEVDYPHGDTTWPDTQLVIEKAWGHLPADELRAMCSENAAALYRHPLPETVLPV